MACRRYATKIYLSCLTALTKHDVIFSTNLLLLTALTSMKANLFIHSLRSAIQFILQQPAINLACIKLNSSFWF